MTTKKGKSKTEILEEKYVLEENDPEYSYEYVITHENADVKKHGELIIKSKDPKFNYLYAKEVIGADKKKHIEAVIESGNIEYIKKCLDEIKLPASLYENLLFKYYEKLGISAYKQAKDIIDRKEAKLISEERAQKLIDRIRMKIFLPDEGEDRFSDSVLLLPEFGQLSSDFDYILSSTDNYTRDQFLLNKARTMNQYQQESYTEELRKKGNSYNYLNFYKICNGDVDPSHMERYEIVIKNAINMKHTTPIEDYIRTLLVIARVMYLDNNTLNKIVDEVLCFNSEPYARELSINLTTKYIEMREGRGMSLNQNTRMWLLSSYQDSYIKALTRLGDYCVQNFDRNWKPIGELMDILRPYQRVADCILNRWGSLVPVGADPNNKPFGLETVKKHMYDIISDYVAKYGSATDNLDFIKQLVGDTILYPDQTEAYERVDKSVYGENYVINLIEKHNNAAIKKYNDNSNNITESQRVEISTRIYENSQNLQKVKKRINNSKIQ